MFTRIAGRYDLMNGIMTGGRHHAWRRIATAAVAQAPAGPALDLRHRHRRPRLRPAQRPIRDRFVVGADFSRGDAASRRREARSARGERGVALLAADALALPFADRTFACVTSAFLLRNLADLEAGPGGDATRDAARAAWWPRSRSRGPACAAGTRCSGCYFNRVVPLIGAAVARDRAAYTYLPQSVERFVTPPQLPPDGDGPDCSSVRYRRLGLGTIAIHVGTA